MNNSLFILLFPIIHCQLLLDDNISIYFSFKILLPVFV
jgi:hypothetical protein